MPRYALLIAYAGHAFAGWWRQPGRTTVASCFAEALARIGEDDAQLQGCARTDAGVHARGQVAQLDTQRSWQPDTLAATLNHHLPEECVCRAAAAVRQDWFIFSEAVNKTYRYRLDVGPTRNPFLATTSWRPPPGPSLADLQAVAPLLIGHQDLCAFARRGDHRHDYQCHLIDIVWQQYGPECFCDITGDRFPYRMVRTLVALMWEVARGGLSTQLLADALQGQANACNRHQAPAKGLCLETIHLRNAPAWHPPAGPAATT